MNVTRHHGDNTGRGLSGFWANCPLPQLQFDMSKGALFMDDFLAFPEVAAAAETDYGSYRGMADTGGSVVSVAGDANDIDDMGAIVFSSNSDNDTAALRWGSAPFVLSTLGKSFWFECRIKKSTIADTKHGIFVGLMEDATLTTTVPIQASGVIADLNLVGFHNLEADGDTFDTIFKANGETAVTVKADAVTIVADTYVNLGMYLDARDDKLYFYKNGVRLAGSATVENDAAVSFPSDICMGPVIGLQNATGSTPGSSTVDWWAAAQLM